MKKMLIIIACITLGILSSISATADDEIKFTLSAEKPENNSAEVILVCDRNTGVSEGEFNILYNSSIISLSGYDFAVDGFSTEEFADEGRMNVKFSKTDNDLSAGGKICSLMFDIKNSDEKLAGVTIEFTSLKDSDGNELSRLVESCEISIPDGIEENTIKNSKSDRDIYDDNSEFKTDENGSVNKSENTDNEADDAISRSIEDENDITEIILLIIGGVMIVAGVSVLIVNFKARNKK